jgi:hypothetical protein
VTRPRLRLALALALLSLPSAAAQAPTTALHFTATPTNGWDSDGAVDARREQATWTVNTTVTFSNTAACTEPVPVKLDLVELSGRTSSGIAQSRTRVDVPAGGGSVSFDGAAHVSLPTSARGGEAIPVRLHGVVGACPSFGTSPKAEANATLEVLPLLWPDLEVEYENRSAAGVFNFTVRNVGNGALLISAAVAPLAGASDQPANAPSGLALDRLEFTVFTLTFPERRPGRYEVTVVGRFNGPGAETQPRGEFRGQVEIPAPIVVRETRNATTFELWAAVLVVGLAGWMRRARI